jgi:hypothetical protein
MTKSSMSRRVNKLEKLAAAKRKSQVPELPEDAPSLFTTDDVQAALDLFNSTKGEGGELEAMRSVMMLSLAVASVNLGVAPQQQS